MKSVFPTWMSNDAMASICFIFGVLLFWIAFSMSGEVTKQNKHEHMFLWYGSNVVVLLAVAFWAVMIGFLGGWL